MKIYFSFSYSEETSSYLIRNFEGALATLFLTKVSAWKKVSRGITSQMSNVASKLVSNNRPPVPFREVTDTKMSFKYDAFLITFSLFKI